MKTKKLVMLDLDKERASKQMDETNFGDNIFSLKQITFLKKLRFSS